jgi:hypothetical protein
LAAGDDEELLFLLSFDALFILLLEEVLLRLHPSARAPSAPMKIMIVIQLSFFISASPETEVAHASGVLR